MEEKKPTKKEITALEQILYAKTIGIRCVVASIALYIFAIVLSNQRNFLWKNTVTYCLLGVLLFLLLAILLWLVDCIKTHSKEYASLLEQANEKLKLSGSQEVLKRKDIMTVRHIREVLNIPPKDTFRKITNVVIYVFLAISIVLAIAEPHVLGSSGKKPISDQEFSSVMKEYKFEIANAVDPLTNCDETIAMNEDGNVQITYYKYETNADAENQYKQEKQLAKEMMKSRRHSEKTAGNRAEYLESSSSGDYWVFRNQKVVITMETSRYGSKLPVSLATIERKLKM